MFSTRRRCTASSSAIKMVTAMAFPATCDYLSRFGALKPMAINVLLRGACGVVRCRDAGGEEKPQQVRPEWLRVLPLSEIPPLNVNPPSGNALSGREQH